MSMTSLGIKCRIQCFDHMHCVQSYYLEQVPGIEKKKKNPPRNFFFFISWDLHVHAIAYVSFLATSLLDNYGQPKW